MTQPIATNDRLHDYILIELEIFMVGDDVSNSQQMKKYLLIIFALKFSSF